jgi:hypothetical protein
MAPAVLPSQTRGFPPEDLARAREITKRVVDLVGSRSDYVKAKGVDPAFAYPDGNWSGDPRNEFLRLFARVAVCDTDAIGQLRAFTQVFSGVKLYEMQDGPVPILEQLDGYTDDAIEAKLSSNLSSLTAWEALTEHLPYRCIFTPPRRFGEIGHDVRGVIINPDTVIYQRLVNFLFDSGVVGWLDDLASANGEVRVLEIGGGYGALASWFRAAFPNCSYTILDLPECLLFSGLYLSLSRPDVRTGWGLEPVPFGMRFAPNYQADFLHDEFDLVINTVSMSEMSAVQVRRYVALMKSRWIKSGGLFFEQNTDNRYMGLLRAQDIFIDEFCSHRRLSSNANLWSMAPIDLPPQVQLLVNGYEDTLYNVCEFDGRIYAVHQSEGPFDIEKVRKGDTAHPVFAGSSVEDVITQLIGYLGGSVQRNSSALTGIIASAC